MKPKLPKITRDQALTNWLHGFEQDEYVVRLEALVGNDVALLEELAKDLCAIVVHVVEQSYKIKTGTEMNLGQALHAAFLSMTEGRIKKSLIETGYYLQANLHKPVAFEDTFESIIWYQHCLDLCKKRATDDLKLPPALEDQVVTIYSEALITAMTAASRFFAGFYCDIDTQLVLANAISGFLYIATICALEGTQK